MTPTAVSEIVEQLLRVIIMIALASLLLPYGLEYAAAGASLGATFGAIGALVVLSIFYKKMRKQIQIKMTNQTITAPLESRKVIIKRLLKLALPVSMSGLMLPIVANMDLILVSYPLLPNLKFSKNSNKLNKV